METENKDHCDKNQDISKWSKEEITAAISKFGFNKCDFEGPLSKVTREIIIKNLEAWGFICVKTWGYDPNNVKWSRYWSRLREFIEETLLENGITGNLKTGLALKLGWTLIAHPTLSEATPAQVFKTFEEAVKDKLTPKGICLKIALMINEESVKSLLCPTNYIPPYITAVRRSTDKGDNSVQVFKIAIKTLIRNVWFLLSIGKSAADIDPGDGSILMS